MIFQNLEFFNVDHLEKVEGMAGYRLERFPMQFSQELGIAENHNGRFRALRAHGCEIRFITEASYFELALMAVEADMDISIYYGDMFHQKHTIRMGICTVMHVEKPENYNTVEREQLTKGRFSPYVWRIQFGMNGYAFFHYLNTFGYAHRPPQSEEKPARIWAAYGSSITCGSVTTLYSNSYIEQAAVDLKLEVMNKGLSGSCLCEPLVADYISGLPVDVVTAELGVNMITSFKEDEFKKRVAYFLEAMKKSKASYIFIIDIFLNKGWITIDKNAPYYVRYRSFKRILEDMMENIDDSRLIHIPGEAIVPDFTYLSTDLLHPSDHGHIRMGRNLRDWMRKSGL